MERRDGWLIPPSLLPLNTCQQFIKIHKERMCSRYDVLAYCNVCRVQARK
nr:MAG TPA: hypothetical protein [Caudoviricetes sp.]